jgi:hypothetical protein
MKYNVLYLDKQCSCDTYDAAVEVRDQLKRTYKGKDHEFIIRPNKLNIDDVAGLLTTTARNYGFKIKSKFTLEQIASPNKEKVIFIKKRNNCSEEIERIMSVVNVNQDQAVIINKEIARQKDITKSEFFEQIRNSKVDNFGDCGCMKIIEDIRKNQG